MSSKSGIITSLVIIIVVFGGVSGFLILTNPFEPAKVAVVVMDPGFGDWGFADNVQLGMDEARYEIAIQYEYPEEYPTTVAEARTQLDALALSGEYILILVLGEELASACSGAAEAYPLQKFGMIGAYVDAPNVMSTSFATEQGAYLAGVLAAAEASSYPTSGVGKWDNIGILAAVDNDQAIARMVDGFIEGALMANSTYGLNISILPTQYIDSYGDNDTAYDMAYEMFANQNVSVIFAPVRASIDGVIRAANQTAADLYYFELFQLRPFVIAAEYNLDFYGCNNPQIPTAPSIIGTSVVADTNIAVQLIIEATFWDEFDSTLHETYQLGSGVNLTVYEYSSTYLEPFTIDAVEEFYTGIINGTFVVTPP
ncbi:MAG: BMP family ABC transporter substrate-binding protein [Candidatus Thorarchaeota archaeon]